MMSDRLKKIVIIGATSAIAEYCARLWVKDNPIQLTLVARNLEKLERVVDHLKVCSPQSIIEAMSIDFMNSVAIQTLANEIVGKQAIDIVLIAHGSLPNQESCQNNLTECSDELMINAVSPVLFLEAFAKHMQKANKGKLAVIGSVAGDRGRKSNYVYGAAKGLITRYAQGLQHRLSSSGVQVILIKPGPTDTPMTAHLKSQQGSFASVERVAEQIVNGIDKGKSLIYVPIKWKLIMMIIRHLPNFIFNKMNI